MALMLHLTVPTIRSQDSSQSNGSGPSTASPGQGFGQPPPPKPKQSTKKKEKGGRMSVIRRAPVENPQFVGSEKEKARAEEEMKNESAFLLSWLGLGGIILLEGIALAASGFLPEDVDNLFVKYLYPVFTPTVVLFVAGTVSYGVLKYLQNDKLKNE